ncbi:hypothetical protein EXIGLDRAFT_718167, partial [Exidia glandulosa HHB12029]
MSSFQEIKASRIAFHEKELEIIHGRATALQDELANARFALADAQHAVVTLALDLDALLSHQGEVISRITEIRREFDPQAIASLPNELLRAVFFTLASILDDECRYRATTWLRHYNEERALMPFRVSAVSRRWRQLALDSPSLWGSYLAFGSSTRFKSAKHYAETVITYSKSSPLDVTIDLESYECTMYSELQSLEDVIRLIG